MSTELISCIVPAFNAATHVGDAIESILAQSYRPLEVIVVDDGSDDATLEIASAYGPPVVTVRQNHAGAAAARNAGLKRARGQFVAFLDADDLWDQDKLRRQMARFATRPELQCSVTHARNLWDGPAGVPQRLSPRRMGTVPGYCTGTLLARRSVFEDIGAFDPSLSHGDGIEWFLRAKERRVCIEMLPDVLIHRRLHGENLSMRDSATAKAELLQVVKAHVDRGTPPPPLVPHASLAGAFEDARSRCSDQAVEHDFLFGSERVRAHIVGRELADQFRRPFAHLAQDPPRPSDPSPTLTIQLWDQHVTGVPCPIEPSALRLPQREVNGNQVFYDTDDPRYLVCCSDGTVSALDRSDNSIIGWRQGAFRLPVAERAKPGLLLVPAWYLRQGIITVHAGLVAREGKGVLLVGEKGAGKSTLSLACVGAGFDFLGDDHVGIEVTAGGATGHALYATARLAADDLERSPALSAGAEIHRPTLGEKLVLFMAESPTATVRRATPVSVIVLLDRDRTPTSELLPASPQQALRALLASVFLDMVTDRKLAFDRLAGLVERVPAFRLTLDGTPRDRVGVVEEAVARAQ